jgi:hypothetical protein
MNFPSISYKVPINFPYISCDFPMNPPSNPMAQNFHRFGISNKFPGLLTPGNSDSGLEESEYYRIQNERDSLFLTMTLTQVRNCIYRVIFLNETKLLTHSPHLSFLPLDPHNRTLSTQLWEIVKRGEDLSFFIRFSKKFPPIFPLGLL